MSPRALISDPDQLRNFFIIAAVSPASGCLEPGGGLNGKSTSPQRVVRTSSCNETFTPPDWQSTESSTPWQMASTFSTWKIELGTVAEPVTCSKPTVLQSR